ncbi:hypothetical protein [Paenibacillus amylolyticus]|uniref:hypothetical protein n=1 Tax=Paenibacillus amylolyticus TaxID=1451 RepID=UPI000FD8A2A2|nr:hypothetical protein [Paenibacillus amylolyticus]
MKIKHTVIKNEDINKHLNQQEKEELLRLFHKIQYGRVSEGKAGFNMYLVINTDETYAEDVVRILQENGHWGPTHDPNQIEFRQEGNTMELPEIKNPI